MDTEAGKVSGVPDKLENQIEHFEEDLKHDVIGTSGKYTQPAIYQEAIDKYPTDESIDEVAERNVIRKLDRRILPLLGICYFFYVRIPPFGLRAWAILTSMSKVC